MLLPVILDSNFFLSLTGLAMASLSELDESAMDTPGKNEMDLINNKHLKKLKANRNLYVSQQASEVRKLWLLNS